MPPDVGEILIDLGPARDQGIRPTCISFAMSDVHRSVIQLDELLSPESLHRAAAVRASTPIEEPVSDVVSLSALEIDGQTTEASWPYNEPVCIDSNAVIHRRPGAREAFDAKSIVNLLSVGTPVVAILDIGEEFFGCTGSGPLSAGDVRPVEACHAVVIKGSRSLSGEHQFLLRNSWGKHWGLNGEVWASDGYLLARSPSILRIY
jgi:hypothetical protein